LAVKRSTEPVRDLSDALLRAKSIIASAPTSREAKVLRIIDAHASNLGFMGFDRLHKVALVTAFPVDIGLEANSVLAGGVLQKPEAAEEVWRELKGIARELAKNRLGLTIREWYDRLSRRNIEFRSEAGGVTAAQLEATKRVLTSYRAALIAKA